MPLTPRKTKSDKNEETALLIGKRCNHSLKQHEKIVKRGNSYRRFIDGDPPKLMGEHGGILPDEDRSQAEYEEKALGKNWDLTSVPAHGMLRQILLPSLVSRPPQWINRDRTLSPNATPEMKERAQQRRALGEIFTCLARHIYREFKVHRELLAAVDDAMTYGVGWLGVDWDPERGMPRIRWRDTRRVLVDTECDSDPFGTNQRWRAEFWTLPKTEAELLARKEWKTRHKFTGIKHEWDQDTRSHDGDELPTEFVRLVYVYVRGNSPYIEKANLSAGVGEKIEEVGKDDVYTGKDELLIMEAPKGWDDEQSYKLVARRPWDFPTDHDDDPLEPVRITHHNRSFYPPSIYQAGHSLQIALNWAVRYHNTDMYNSARRVIAFLEGAFDEQTREKILHSQDNLVTAAFKSQADMERALRVIDFGRPNPALKDGIAGNDGMYREVSSLSSFDAEGKSHETATRAALDSQGAQLRIGSMADRVEDAIQNAMKKAMFCAMKNMTAEEVAETIGYEEPFQFQWIEDPDTGDLVRYSPVWNDELFEDTAAMRNEAWINLEPKSARFVSPEQEINDMDRLTAKGMEWLGKVIETNEMNPQLAGEIARVGNNWMKRYAERLYLPNADELMMDLSKATTPPPEMMQQQQQAAMEGQGGSASMKMLPGGGAQVDVKGPMGPPTRALANLTDQLGLDPSLIPGELGQNVINEREAG